MTKWLAKVWRRLWILVRFLMPAFCATLMRSLRSRRFDLPPFESPKTYSDGSWKVPFLRRNRSNIFSFSGTSLFHDIFTRFYKPAVSAIITSRLGRVPFDFLRDGDYKRAPSAKQHYLGLFYRRGVSDVEPHKKTEDLYSTGDSQAD